MCTVSSQDITISSIIYSFSLALFLSLLFKYKMAELDHSSQDTSAGSIEKTSEESKQVFSEAEETLITMMYNLVGQRWNLIAGRIPGRTAEEIEKYWTSRYLLNK